MSRFEARTSQVFDRALLESDFETAVLSLFGIRNKRTKVISLGFATVELLHKRQNLGPIVVDRSENISGGELVIHWKRNQLSVRRALTWFDMCRAGRVLAPAELTKLDQDGFPHTHGQFAGEPKWPAFALDTMNFWGANWPYGRFGANTGRRCLLIPTRIDTHLSEIESEKAEEIREWIDGRAVTNIQGRKQMFGSVGLVVPNPILREVSIRLSSKDSSTILLRLLPWPEKFLDGLFARVADFRPDGAVIHYDLDDLTAFSVIKLKQEPYRIAVTIYDRTRGLVFDSPPAPFIKRLQLDIGVSVGQRSVEIPAKGKRRAEKALSALTFHDQPTVVGASSDPESYVTGMAVEQLAIAQNEKFNDQRMFHGDVDGATDFVRSLIRRARRSVFFVDPYFGDIELRRFGLATEDYQVSLRILTGRDAFASRFDADTSEMEALKALNSTLFQVKGQKLSNPVDVRVMMGEAEVHDRFIVVDDEVWTMGSSLNEFGRRLSMAIRLRAADLVVGTLEEIWRSKDEHRILPFDEYLLRRLAALGERKS